MINVGGPAFPYGNPTHGGEIGMTLRDYFAARAMEAMITKGMEDNKRGAAGVPFIVKYAYEYADAMIEARKQGE